MRAFIIVDVQNDFTPGGALAVREGDQIIPVINELQAKFELIVATQDWHPADHSSFAAQHAGCKIGDVIDLDGVPQIMWPTHCVENTFGAEFHKNLDRQRISKVIPKGTDRAIDSYSGFFDNGHRKSTALDAYLKEKHVSRVFICGLATDYCVKFTAIDAFELGYETSVVVDAVRGVELQEGDVARSLHDMQQLGIKLVDSRDIAEDSRA